jgi:hypothetical protein
MAGPVDHGLLNVPDLPEVAVSGDQTGHCETPVAVAGDAVVAMIWVAGFRQNVSGSW